MVNIVRSSVSLLAIPKNSYDADDVFEDVCFSPIQTDQYLSEGREKFAALYQAALAIWNNDPAARKQAIAIVRAKCEEAVRIAADEQDD